MDKSYFVYMLASNNNSALYTGVTNDLSRRLTEHRNDLVEGYTKKYHVHKLVHFEAFSDIMQAIEREKQIKSWSRARKDELVISSNLEWKDLSELPQ